MWALKAHSQVYKNDEKCFLFRLKLSFLRDQKIKSKYFLKSMTEYYFRKSSGLYINSSEGVCDGVYF